tara:strand:- start:156 stop:617 length:462 start_codon:yes stop_codon:yes gene_type:complete
MLEIKINGNTHKLDIEPDTPLLWAIRDTIGLTGTKYGCGIQQCGACTVLIKGRPVRSCGVTIEEVSGQDITTIEGLSDDNTHPVQKAWIAEEVPQCGYCQSGQIMAAVSLLERKPNPTDKDIDRGMLNLCRCGTYPRIRKAIHSASKLLKEVS